MTRMDRMKYGNIISIPNSNILQKKVKKMLNNLKSDEIRKNDDIQDFKNQFENSKKKAHLELLIFKKNLKVIIIHLNKLDIIIFYIKIMIIFL
jgi:hypothetical protein